MNWEAAGAIGEIVGAIAVVITLLYVTVQLRQNTRSAQNATWQGLATMLSNLDITEATDPALNTFIEIVEQDPNSVPEEEYWRFTKIAQARFGMLEYAYLAGRNGTLDDYFWGGIDPYLNYLIGKPGYRKFWVEAGENFYHPDFIAHVNENFESTGPA